MDFAHSSSQLVIERVSCQYLATAQHPAPRALQDSLDELIVSTVPRRVAGWLEAVYPPSDPGVWLIRRLDVDITLDLGWEPDHLAEKLAAQITRSLAGCMQGSGDGQEVVYFKDRAAYLACFLVDLANQRAWGRWYYTSFDGLRALPVSLAIRSAILQEHRTGAAALIRLEPAELAQVTRQLTAADAARVLAGLASTSVPASTAGALQAVWENWSEGSGDEPHQALIHYLHACRSRPELAGPALAEAARALTLLERLAAERGQAVIAALLEPNPAALYRMVGAAAAERLAVLRSAPPGWLAAAANAMQRGEAPAQRPMQGSTRFGGAFLLLRLLAELPEAPPGPGWPEVGEVPPGRLLRFLLLIKCLGRQNALGVFHDPLLRDLCGLPSSLSPELARRWQRKLRLEMLDEWLFKATGAAATGASNAEAAATSLLALVKSPGGRQPAAVLLDAQRSAWLAAVPITRTHTAEAVERLAPWLAAAHPPAALLLDPALELGIVPQQAGVTVISLDAACQEKLAALPGSASLTGSLTVDELQARLKQLPGDLEYLSLPPALRGPRSVDLALSAAAQRVLRSFSGRLPGFSRASLPHLFTNFLDFRATLELEPGSATVRLGRPPLSLILNMTGMARAAYTLSWLDNFHLKLYPEE